MANERADHLTERERQVVLLLADGLTSKEVAARLGISPGTVEKHVETIMIKLRARNRVQMALIAVTTGLLDRPISHSGGGQLDGSAG